MKNRKGVKVGDKVRLVKNISGCSGREFNKGDVTKVVRVHEYGVRARRKGSSNGIYYFSNYEFELIK